MRMSSRGDGGAFLDFRTFYKSDPQWSKVQTYPSGGDTPALTCHRFWAQAESPWPWRSTAG